MCIRDRPGGDGCCRADADCCSGGDAEDGGLSAAEGTGDKGAVDSSLSATDRSSRSNTKVARSSMPISTSDTISHQILPPVTADGRPAVIASVKELQTVLSNSFIYWCTTAFG